MKVREALAQCGLVPVDAQVLLAHVVERDRSWIAAHRDDDLPKAHADAFFALAKRRREGEPVAYLTGVKEFWGLPLRVTSAVLVPRPETETLVELALESIPRDAAARVLDLATGSGAVALAIAHERPRASVIATDVSRDALDVARGNAERLALKNVAFVESDWWTAVEGRFDAIVSNPPYVETGDPHLEGDVRFEPQRALVPPGDALSALRTIVTRAPAFLEPRGLLAVEHGYDQSEAVQALMRAAGFDAIAVRRDLAGIPRVVGGRLP
ncbi:MAG: peptide chain release factor N(5)-glutamine methyltransferase [Burkholderiales bacterium]